MPDNTASLQLRFGVKAQPDTFRLEIDNRDAAQNKPVKVFPYSTYSFQWTDEQYERQCKDVDVLKVKENGVQCIRLYTPRNTPCEMICTELPVSVPNTENTKQYSTVVPDMRTLEQQINNADPFYKDFLTPFGPVYNQYAYARIGTVVWEDAPPTSEYVGRFETVVSEALTWKGDRVQYLKNSYVDSFAVAYASSFVTAGGRTIDPPKFFADLGAAFICSEECYGALVVKYKVGYNLYKVRYGLPPSSVMRDAQLAWLRGDITQFPFPPVTAIVISALRGMASTIDFEKVVSPSGASLVSWGQREEKDINEGFSTSLQERGRTTEDVVVQNPDDPEQTVTVQRAREITLTGQDGKPWKLTLN